MRHMTRLIDDLLDVGRITNDRLILQIAPVELADVVDAAVETSRPLIAERRHHPGDRPAGPADACSTPTRLGSARCWRIS